MVGGGAGGAQLKGLEASLKGAVARLTRVTEEKEGLKVKVLELERTNVQMQEALARKGTQLQRAVEAQERLEVTVEEQRVKAEALQGELKTLNEANSHAAEMARYVKDLEKEKEDLFTDGKRVMEDKGVLEKTIKTLRQQLKDKDKDVESVKDGLMSEQARVKGFEERYVCMYACIYIYTYTHTHKFMAFFLLHKKIYM
jgi:chromosome segregation ATPase